MKMPFPTDKELMSEIHDLLAMPEASTPIGVVPYHMQIVWWKVIDMA